MKTSIEIPQAVWQAAKIRALDERKDLQDIVTEALVELLTKKAKVTTEQGNQS